MIKRVFITTILTGLLIGIPYLVFKNYTHSLDRGEELSTEFKKIKSQEIERIKLLIVNNSDSLIVDSTVIDKDFCRQLKEELLRLPDHQGPSSRLIWNKKISMDVLTTANEHVNVDLYVTDITGLVFIKTKSKDWIEGLDDLYSSTNLKDIFEHTGVVRKSIP